MAALDDLLDRYVDAGMLAAGFRRSGRRYELDGDNTILVAGGQTACEPKPGVLQRPQKRGLCLATAALRPLNRLLIHARSVCM